METKSLKVMYATSNLIDSFRDSSDGWEERVQIAIDDLICARIEEKMSFKNKGEPFEKAKDEPSHKFSKGTRVLVSPQHNDSYSAIVVDFDKYSPLWYCVVYNQGKNRTFVHESWVKELKLPTSTEEAFATQEERKKIHVFVGITDAKQAVVASMTVFSIEEAKLRYPHIVAWKEVIFD